MLTTKDTEEFEELGEFLRKLRNKCELQGKIFKDYINNDANLGINHKLCYFIHLFIMI